MHREFRSFAAHKKHSYLNKTFHPYSRQDAQEPASLVHSTDLGTGHDTGVHVEQRPVSAALSVPSVILYCHDLTSSAHSTEVQGTITILIKLLSSETQKQFLYPAKKWWILVLSKRHTMLHISQPSWSDVSGRCIGVYIDSRWWQTQSEQNVLRILKCRVTVSPC